MTDTVTIPSARIEAAAKAIYFYNDTRDMDERWERLCEASPSNAQHWRNLALTALAAHWEPTT